MGDTANGSAGQPSTPPQLAVGARVRVLPPTAPTDESESSAHPVGVVVDDFRESLAAFDRYGRDWAHTKRWAVALESGTLVFRNDEELEVIDGAPQASPES